MTDPLLHVTFDADATVRQRAPAMPASAKKKRAADPIEVSDDDDVECLGQAAQKRKRGGQQGVKRGAYAPRGTRAAAANMFASPMVGPGAQSRLPQAIATPIDMGNSKCPAYAMAFRCH